MLLVAALMQTLPRTSTPLSDAGASTMVVYWLQDATHPLLMPSLAALDSAAGLAAGALPGEWAWLAAGARTGATLLGLLGATLLLARLSPAHASPHALGVAAAFAALLFAQYALARGLLPPRLPAPEASPGLHVHHHHSLHAVRHSQ